MLWLYSFFAVAMVINMFITGGRAGQVMFFVSMLILVFQYFEGQKIKALIVSLILIPGIFIAAYQTSPYFTERVNLIIDEVVGYDKEILNPHNRSSTGLRILFWSNTWEIIEEHPLLGVGTGDFRVEYKRVNEINSPTSMLTKIPIICTY